MLDALRHADDPGLPARPLMGAGAASSGTRALRARLLAASNAIDLPRRPARAYPRCLMARTCLLEALALLLLTAVLYGVLVAT